jgi:hypothetical protein
VTISDITSAVFGSTIEAGLSFLETQRLQNAVLFGISSGGGTENIVYRNVADTANRIAAEVNSMGNRISITLVGS